MARTRCAFSRSALNDEQLADILELLGLTGT
jgi:hypothetical protein